MGAKRRDDIAEELRKLGYYKTASKEVIDDIFAVISKFLMQGDSVTIWQFGTFEVKTAKGHMARDPVTNEIRRYDDYQKPVFRPTDRFRETVKKACGMEPEEREKYIEEKLKKLSKRE